MSKKLFIISLFTFTSIFSFSQVFIGLTGNFSKNTDKNSQFEKLIGFTINPGYHVLDNLNISLLYSLGKRIPSIVDQNIAAYGLNIEYYLSASKIKPFIGIIGAYTTSQNKDEINGVPLAKEKGYLISPTLGLNISPSENWHFSINAKYDLYSFDNPLRFITLNAGIRYYLNFKKVSSKHSE